NPCAQGSRLLRATKSFSRILCNSRVDFISSFSGVMHVSLVRLLAVMMGFALTALTGCESTESTAIKEKKHPPLPGEEVSDLSWSRPTGPNDVVTPMGLPMSH